MSVPHPKPFQTSVPPSFPEESKHVGADTIYGSIFPKAAIRATKRLAQEILEKGTVASMKEGMQTPEIGALVAKKKAT